MCWEEETAKSDKTFGRRSRSPVAAADTRLKPNMALRGLFPFIVFAVHAQVYPPEVFHDDHDFMLTPEQQAILHGRKASSNLTAYWSDDGGFPLIPFAFYDAYVNRYKVWMAILEWEQATCIDFVEVSTGYSGPHLKIQRHADDCRSFIGMVSTTGQDFYISEDCEGQHGELLHLLGYAIGFWPEETRSDRNHYVQINNDNVLATVVDNFPLNSDNNYSVPFDYCSIMFHHERAFTNNGGITIATLDPLYQGVLGQRSQMSHMDKLLANTMYQCADKLLSKCSLGSDPCSNSGYLDKSCSCICPDGTSGTYCDTVTSAYGGQCLSSYSETITSDTSISSPSSPASPSEIKFTKVIKAPECYLVRASFTSFSIYQKTNHYVTDSTLLNICWYDGLEIRTDDMYDGSWYCGTELNGQNVTSTSNEMILYFKSKLNYMPGWTANIAFIEDPACITSTSSTSTSTATSTSTTTPSSGDCTIIISADTVSFQSPNYPSHYPNNKVCTLPTTSMSTPGSVRLVVTAFDLAAGDELVIQNPYTSPLQLSAAIASGTEYRLPSLLFLATFSSDGSLASSGFSLSFQLSSTGCHKSRTAFDAKSVITSPRYPRAHVKAGTYCEYRIAASDPSKRVKLYFKVFRVWSPSYVALNPSGDAYHDGNVVVLQNTVSVRRYESVGDVFRIYFHNEVSTVGFKMHYYQIV
ncbi:protein SpAN [Penaeus vannamei]|uniref:protein SpAN n=1 Tax=Penaeus vannamei TaxID=6689 RepID=UPI000F68FDC6|nr:protein SpAN-like isoform X1 [Penaeus vannamei]